jgi:mannose-1-phosphate guanylyltransferase
LGADNVFAVIMAGGKGTRFWPLSREDSPKQLLPITGDTPMLRATVDRIRPLTPPERILVVTGRSHAEGVRAILPDLPTENILVEPQGRNTAPCIGLAAHAVQKRSPQGVMLVLPADHAIENQSAFLRLAEQGVSLASQNDVLVTMGLEATRPETGYGYIEPSAPVPALSPAMPVASFHEKPDAKTASQYMAQGFFWNSGIFIWRADIILERIKTHLPDLAEGLSELAGFFGKKEFDSAVERIYPTLPSISIDFGVMEKARGVVVLPAAGIGWSDVGSWTAASEYWPVKDGSRIKGRALMVDSQGCQVYSPDRLVTLVGVEDLVVVDTPDAILICRRDKDQDVKKAVEALKAQGRDDLL